MSKTLTAVNTVSGHFSDGFTAINALISALATEVATANGSSDGGLTVGNGYVAGIFGGTTLVANTLRGGTVNTATPLTVGSNLTFNTAFSLINGNVVANSTALSVGANVILSTSKLSVGNTTVNSVVNSSSLVIGPAVVNTSQFFIGNTTVNFFANSTAVSLGAALLTPTILSFGNSTINATMNSTGFAINGALIGSVSSGGSNTQVQFNDSGALGGLPGFTFNKTTNVVFIANGISTGNSTINSTVNSSLITISTPGVTANLAAAGLAMGVINVNTSHYFVGNSTINSYMNSTFLCIQNATQAANIQPNQFNLGANLQIDTVKMFVGNTIANSTINSTAFQILNATSSFKVNPNQFSVGNSTSNVFVNSTMLIIGSSSNIQVNSTTIIWSDGSTQNSAPSSAVSLAYATLTDAASIAVDFATTRNMVVTINGNRTLANATNIPVGDSGILRVIQDSTGSRTLSFAAMYNFDGDTAFTIGTTANKSSFISWHAITATKILLSLVAVNVS